MSEAKTYVFGNEGGSSWASLLAPLLQQRGVDPNLLAALSRNNNGFDGSGGWFIWVIFLFFLMGWGRNGWGNGGNSSDGLSSALNNDAGREMLMSAIQGNRTAISELASTLNCSTGNIQQAINAVQGAVCQVGNQVGLSGQQVINFIQQGNMSLAQQLSSCCCDVRESVTKMGYDNQLSNANQTAQLLQSINNVGTSLERGFSESSYATQAQTCALQDSIKSTSQSGTTAIIAKLDAMQTQALQDKIDSLREKNSQQAVIINNAQQSAVFGQMISQATTPIATAINSLQAEVNSVKCRLPETVTLPYSCATAIPTAAAYGLGLYGYTPYFG